MCSLVSSHLQPACCVPPSLAPWAHLSFMATTSLWSTLLLWWVKHLFSAFLQGTTSDFVCFLCAVIKLLVLIHKYWMAVLKPASNKGTIDRTVALQIQRHPPPIKKKLFKMNTVYRTHRHCCSQAYPQYSDHLQVLYRYIIPLGILFIYRYYFHVIAGQSQGSVLPD